MKLVYFDCFAGVSGDMILGAVVDAGVSIDALRTELGKLNLSGFSLHSEKCVKNGIAGTKVTVHTDEQKSHRHLHHIREIFDKSALTESVKTTSLNVFQALAEAEARIHDTSPEKIHFHEVGALDAIVDVVGAAAGLELLGVDQVWASPVRVGTGLVDCQHGRIPVPAPATVEILKSVPVYSTGLEAELITPTGAAILKTIAAGFGPMPSMCLEKVGYGAGSRDLPIPNHLRLLVGTSEGKCELDQVDLIEANIDDMTPVQFEYVIDRLMAAAALDATLTPMVMKKSRPAICLGVMARPEDTQRMLDIVFDETSTLGVRVQRVERRKLPREIRSVKTKFGEIRVKVAWLDGKVRDVAPEYDDCRRLADDQGIPLREVYREAARAAGDSLPVDTDEGKDDEAV
jgi:uncharacterized protein (TIGR00299 family) protein